ncbi:MAG: biotin transporter BioY [Cyanobacteria bacterium NC_groundwater_1444_Ag_S-0.65um_54_12]|nr:biotin transporter BioY [Cyanobacteria bacterium NC_groundwater_1444_Ag_S-0.65um_54_12]
MIVFLNLLLAVTFTALGTFVPLRVPFLTWGEPALPAAQLVASWGGVVFGWCTVSLQIPLVWLSGIVLGRRLGVVSMALLLALGLSGLPIFMEGGGLGYLGRPTFGYLLGFLPAAYFCGIWAQPRIGERKLNSPLWILTGLVLGQLAMWAVGLSWQVIASGGALDRDIWYRSLLGLWQLGPSYLLLMIVVTLVGKPLSWLILQR